MARTPVRFFNKILRSISKSEWTARLLSYPLHYGKEPGLVMIQIDGLSRYQLQQAVTNGKMPFVKHLLETKNYRMHSLYSGIPSSTPAFQAELFYGVRGAVPAFGFHHRLTNENFHMLTSKAVNAIQDALSESGEELLKGGSAYVDIYTGGAQKANFCVTNMGFGDMFKRTRPHKLAIISAMHAFLFLRMLALFIIEVVLAFTDLFRGIIHRENFFQELNFIPARVGICILIRELVTAGVKIDLLRGLPVIHCNFLGYDEQSHRRGPSSRFAHWTLRGIDDCIRRIHTTAQTSGRRPYTIWIYSDHGQEQCKPYPGIYGRSIRKAVSSALDEIGIAGHGIEGNGHEEGVQNKRITLLGSRLFKKHRNHAPQPVTVSAIGPLAHVYLETEMDRDMLEKTAPVLREKISVPAILIKDGKGGGLVWNEKGRWNLPGQIVDVLGPGHPFAEEIARDLVDLLHHPDSGDFVLSGWIPGKTPVSFPDENGAHAGPGSEETHAFLLVPDGTDIETKTYYRALDMRKAALRVLNRTSNTGDLSGGSLQDCTPEHSGNTGTDSHTKCALQKSQ